MPSRMAERPLGVETAPPPVSDPPPPASSPAPPVESPAAGEPDVVTAPAEEAPVEEAPAAPPPAPAAPPPRREPPPPPAPETGSGWAVQVGSFDVQSNARGLTDQLAQSDYPSFMSREVVNGQVRYRVRVGPVTTREEAVLLRERLENDGQDTAIVRHP